MGSLPIGQEISVTALQLAVAFSAIANNGRMMKPYVVQEIIYPDKKSVGQNRPRFVRQAIRPETAKTLTEMLEGVVTHGTGTNARIEGYRVAGKTGTAQKADPVKGGYYRDKYVAVFAGFVPADDPVACIVVVADSPRGKHYGGDVAAPAFAEIAKGILNYLEIPPTEPEELKPRRPDRSTRPVPAPDRVPGNGNLMIANDKGLFLMPDLRGMTMKAVADSVLARFVSLEFEGSGVAFRQNPAPGAGIEAGQRVRIAFKRMDIE